MGPNPNPTPNPNPNPNLNPNLNPNSDPDPSPKLGVGDYRAHRRDACVLQERALQLLAGSVRVSVRVRVRVRRACCKSELYNYSQVRSRW